MQDAYRRKLPEEERDMVAAEVEANAKFQLELQNVTLQVRDILVMKDPITLQDAVLLIVNYVEDDHVHQDRGKKAP